jgi:hypothetical protein
MRETTSFPEMELSVTGVGEKRRRIFTARDALVIEEALFRRISLRSL